jgi:acetyl-CoA C-acetyltransferase
MINDIYLAGAARTPIGAFCGALESVPAPALGAEVARAALRRASVPGRSRLAPA